MKITCIYFSGTYNTQWVAEKFCEKLASKGHDVKVLSCEEDFDVVKEVNACDMLGIAFPVYASFAPLPMQNLIELLPEVMENLYSD